MLCHIVLLKLLPEATKDQIANLNVGLKSLNRIDGVVEIQCGAIEKEVYPGYDDRTKGYTHTLLVVLKNKKALEQYDKDQYHLLIKNTIIGPLVDRSKENPVLAVDFEDALPKKCAWHSTCAYWTLGTVTAVVAAYALGRLRAGK